MLIRNHPPPQEHHSPLGIVLLKGPRGVGVFLWARYPCTRSTGTQLTSWHRSKQLKLTYKITWALLMHPGILGKGNHGRERCLRIHARSDSSSHSEKQNSKKNIITGTFPPQLPALHPTSVAIEVDNLGRLEYGLRSRGKPAYVNSCVDLIYQLCRHELGVNGLYSLRTRGYQGEREP